MAKKTPTLTSSSGDKTHAGNEETCDELKAWLTSR